LTTETIPDSAWGQLSQPIHSGAPTTDAPWRDNAFLAFWDPGQDLFGVAHVSTSPNAEGRRARFSVVLAGQAMELIEPLERGSFSSEHIGFDVANNTVTVDAPGLKADLAMTPRFVCADYSPTGLIPDLVADVPLRHFQQGADISGQLTLGSERVTVTGQGWRDRSWGPRDESAAWAEYVAVVACLPDFDLTVMKFRAMDDKRTTHGFLMYPDHTVTVTGMDLRRDGSGLVNGAVLTTADEQTLTMHMQSARGGLWVPMGAGGPPPTFSAYDDAADIELDGQTGAGFSEQGILRLL
jgi:hypothetical protein